MIKQLRAMYRFRMQRYRIQKAIQAMHRPLVILHREGYHNHSNEVRTILADVGSVEVTKWQQYRLKGLE